MAEEIHSAAADGAGIRPVAADRGWGWLVESFDYFKRAPGTWIGMVVILGVIMLVLSLIPLLGVLAVNVLTPIFMGGLMLACRRQSQGEAPEIPDLFAGFKTRTSQLAIVGVLYMVGMLVVMLIGGGIGAAVGASAMSGAMSPGMGMDMNMGVGAGMAMGAGMLLAGLVTMALSVPLVMALWFAPALVVFQELEPVEAMKRSFFGCLKNIVPFLVYGVLAFVLCFLAAIPLMLGFLVVGPMLIASAYIAYSDIFG